MKRFIIFIHVLFLLSSCGGKSSEEQAEAPLPDSDVAQLTEEQFKNAGIQTERLQRRSISSILKVNGEIDVPPQNLVSISVPMGGFLRSTKLLPGMHVYKGEELAVMEDQQYIQLQQDYLTAKAQFVFTDAEYNRQKELNQTKAISDKVFQQVEANYQTQKVLLRALEEKLELIGLNPQKVTAENISKSISIKSPINGFVSAVNVNIGRYVNTSDVLFEIVNPEDIHLGLTIFEKDLGKIAIGQKLVAYTNADPQKKYPCSIILISKSLSADRATEVHCHFDNYDKSLIPGMYMNADIEVQSQDALVIPNDAIVRFEGKQYIFEEIANKKYQMKEVEVFNSENGFTQISLVEAEETTNKVFVTKGAYNLLMKLKNTEE